MDGSTLRVWVRRDVAAGAVTIAGAILLVATAGPAMVTAVRSFNGGDALDGVLATSAILNVALVLFSWRLYAGLQDEAGRRKTAEERIGFLTRQDALTGLANRQTFLDDAAVQLRKNNRRGRKTALLLLDLDHFKTVNEVNGHSIGDATLQLAARLVEETAPAGAMAGRLGAE